MRIGMARCPRVTGTGPRRIRITQPKRRPTNESQDPSMPDAARLTVLAIAVLGVVSGAEPAFADAHPSLIEAPIIGPLETVGAYALVGQAQQQLSESLGAALPVPAGSPLAPTTLLGTGSPLLNLEPKPDGVTVGSALP